MGVILNTHVLQTTYRIVSTIIGDIFFLVPVLLSGLPVLYLCLRLLYLNFKKRPWRVFLCLQQIFLLLCLSEAVFWLAGAIYTIVYYTFFAPPSVGPKIELVVFLAFYVLHVGLLLFLVPLYRHATLHPALPPAEKRRKMTWAIFWPLAYCSACCVFVVVDHFIEPLLR